MTSATALGPQTELIIPIAPQHGEAFAALNVALTADHPNLVGIVWWPKRNRLIAVLEWHRVGASEWATCGRLEAGQVCDQPHDTRVDPETISLTTRREIEQAMLTVILARLADAACAAFIHEPEAERRLRHDAAAMASTSDPVLVGASAGLVQLLADLALPSDYGNPHGLTRGTRRMSADPSRYGADVVAAWVCRRVDGSVVVVRHHADGSWSSSAADELDAPARTRAVLPSDSVELAAAQAVHNIRDALYPVRVALSAAPDGMTVSPMTAGTLAGITAAVDRTLAEVTHLVAALEREGARRG